MAFKLNYKLVVVLFFLQTMFGSETSKSDLSSTLLTNAEGRGAEYESKNRIGEFGSAIITYIRNNTNYPLSFGGQNNDLSLLGSLPNNSVVRLKSLARAFGARGRYLSLTEKEGLSFLQAKDDLSTLPTDFMVKKYLNPQTQTTYLGLTLAQDPARYLIADQTNLVQLSVVPGGFATNQGKMAHWTIKGPKLSECYLQNQANQGFVGPLPMRLIAAKNPTFVSETISWKEFNVKSEISFEQLKNGLSEDNSSFSWANLLWRSNKALSLWADSKLQNLEAKTLANKYLELAKQKFEAVRPAKKAIIKYGDRIKIGHHETMQFLSASSSGQVFCDHDGQAGQSADGYADWWIIKGPHGGQNRFNCVIGAPVKVGDLVRLEHLATGKNLTVTDLSPSGGGKQASPAELSEYKKSLTTALQIPGDVNLKKLSLNGQNGVGSDDDNFIFILEEGASDSFLSHVKCSFKHGMTGAILFSAQHFELNSDLAKWVQVALAYAPKQFDANKNSADLVKEIQNTTDIAAPWMGTKHQWMVVARKIVELPKEAFATGFIEGDIFSDGADNGLAIEVVSLGAGKEVLPGQTLTQTIPLATEKPIVRGFSSQSLESLDIDSLIVLPPLLSKGAAWYTTATDVAGSFAFTFLAETQEEGNIEVLLGTDVALNWLYKIVMRGQGQRVEILKQEVIAGKNVETEVFSITSKENSLAKILPGKFMPYWVSFYENSLSFGVGLTPGYNIIVSWKDEKPKFQPTRIGFGSGKIETSYTTVKFSAPVKLTAPQTTLAKFENPINLTQGNEFWLEKTLRAPGVGTISFQVQGEGELALLMTQNKQPGSQQLALKINTDQNSLQLLEWDYLTGVYKTAIDSGRQEDFNVVSASKTVWISFDDRHIYFGADKGFGQLKMLRPKNRNLSQFKQLGFLCKKGEFKIDNVVISTPVALAPIETKNTSLAEGVLDKNSMFIISPFEYHLDQSGPSIIFKDKIQNTSQFVGKAVQRGASYEFLLSIAKDGLPTAVWTREPENAEQLRKLVGAKALRGIGQTLFMASGYIESSGPMLWADISDGKWDTGGVVAAGASVAMTTAGAALALGGIKLEKDAMFDYEAAPVLTKERKMGPSKETVVKSHESRVYEDFASQKQLATSSIPEVAIQNKSRIEDELYLGQQWSPSDPAKLSRLLALYSKVVGLVVHPHVVAKPIVKTSLINNLESLWQAFDSFYGQAKQVEPIFSFMLETMLMAYLNPYLTDTFKAEDRSVRQGWLAKISSIASKILSLQGSLALPILNNIPVWLLEQALPEPAKGTIKFTATGQGGLGIIVAAQIPDLGQPFQGYKVVFGYRSSDEIAILLNDYTEPVASIKLPEDLFNSIVQRSFWVKIDNAKITVGKDFPDAANVLLEWLDPYPFSTLEGLGLSTKDSAATVSQFSILPLTEA